MSDNDQQPGPIQQDWETRQLVQTLTNALHVMQTTVHQFETTVKSRLTDISDRVDRLESIMAFLEQRLAIDEQQQQQQQQPLPAKQPSNTGKALLSAPPPTALPAQ